MNAQDTHGSSRGPLVDERGRVAAEKSASELKHKRRNSKLREGDSEPLNRCNTRFLIVESQIRAEEWNKRLVV